MIIDNDVKLDFDDVLLVPQRSTLESRENVEVYRGYKFYHHNTVHTGSPIVAANMDCVGTVAMDNALALYGGFACLSKYLNSTISPDDGYAISLGMSNEALLQIVERGLSPHIIRIDVPNGYMEKFTEFCAKVRKLFPTTIIFAGNVCTPEMVQELIIHGGVDVVVIGIGPGSACSTRSVTGVGYPQLSAIMECSQVAHGLRSKYGHGLICADGGCKTPGDVCKALAAGADFVMLGGMLAGTDECDGEWEYSAGRPSFFSYYGMSSYDAQAKHGGLDKTYRAAEGYKVRVPYKGSVENVMKEIFGGIRSCCTYIGASCVKDIPKCAKFIRVNRIK